jgi:Bacterial antitoxin of type II TA system, VapB
VNSCPPQAGTKIPTRSDSVNHAHSIFTCMRIALTLDDDLLAIAESYTGLKEKSALVREALLALVERESARRLAALGGSESALKPIGRRKTSA